MINLLAHHKAADKENNKQALKKPHAWKEISSYPSLHI
jgi:hypothetical protein